MGNGQCHGVTASGSRCKRKATQGDYCKQHHEQAEAEVREVVQGQESRDPPSELELEYEALARKCLLEADKDGEKSAVRVQWMRLAIDCVRLLKEEQRLDAGKFTVFHVVHEDPLEPEGETPPLPELPPPGDGD